MRGRVWAALALALWAGAAPAQEFSLGRPSAAASQIVVVDMEQLFQGSAYGRSVVERYVAQIEQMAAENRQLEADLEQEARDLKTRRPGMAPEAFRAQADAFDEKVQAIRRERDARERSLRDGLGGSQQQFVAAVEPLLRQIMQQRGASVLLERRSVIIAAPQVDITQAAIAAVDAQLAAPAP